MERSEAKPSRRWMLPFFAIWGGQQCSIIGSMLAQFALVWWVTELTGSATVLATASMVALIPEVLLGPFIGALVDRWPRRRVMIIADSVVALLSLGLAILFALDQVQIWHIYALMLGRAVGGAFHWPAMAAATPMLVPGEHLARVNGLNSTLYGVRGIIGPALGALAVATLPMVGVMGVDVATALLAVLPLLFVPIPDPQRSDAGEPVTPRGLFRDIGEALRYIWHWQGLFWLLVIATVINLLGHPTYTLTPLMVREHFARGAAEYGVVEVALGIGMVAGGLLVSIWGGSKRLVFTILGGMGANALLFAVIGWLPGGSGVGAFSVFVGSMFLVGVAGALTNAPFFALLQGRIPPEMIGRVMTLVMSMAGAAAPLGLALAGPFGDRFGVQSWYLLAGLGGLALTAVAFLTPAILRLEDGPAASAEA